MVEDVERTPVRRKRRRRKALYYTSEKERFSLSIGKKNASRKEKNVLLNTIEETVKTLDFYTISTMAMEDNEDEKSEKHAHDRILE